MFWRSCLPSTKHGKEYRRDGVASTQKLLIPLLLVMISPSSHVVWSHPSWYNLTLHLLSYLPLWWSQSPSWSHPPCYDLILLAVISHLICHDLTPCYAPCYDLIHTGDSCKSGSLTVSLPLEFSSPILNKYINIEKDSCPLAACVTQKYEFSNSFPTK